MNDDATPQPGFVELGSQSVSWREVFSVVETFYSKVARDEMLSVPFASVEDWPLHIKRLTHFWWVRLGGKPYFALTYNPVLKHFDAGFTLPLLDRWIALFKETLYTRLDAPKAEAWLNLAQNMGAFLNQQNDLMKKRRTEQNRVAE